MTAKPRMVRAQDYDGGGWHCYGAAGHGFGDTQEAAYKMWSAQKCCRADREWSGGEGLPCDNCPLKAGGQDECDE